MRDSFKTMLLIFICTCLVLGLLVCFAKIVSDISKAEALDQATSYLIDGKMRIITKYQQQGIPLVFFGSGKLYAKDGLLCLEGNKLSDLFMVDTKDVTDKDGAKRTVFSFPRRKDNDFNKEVGIGDVIYISDGEIVQADPIIGQTGSKQ